MLLDTGRDTIDAFRRASDCFEVITENCEEFLNNNASGIEVLKDSLHVLRFGHNLLDVGEIPPSDCDFGFNIHLGFIVLLLPFLKHRNALLDDSDGVFRGLLEDLRQLDVFADLSADFIGDGFNDFFKLLVRLVDMARNGPNEFQTIEQRGEGFFNGFEVTTVDVFELTFQRGEELNEVLSLSVMLGELLLLV